jgi:hypothetical protein
MTIIITSILFQIFSLKSIVECPIKNGKHGVITYQQYTRLQCLKELGHVIVNAIVLRACRELISEI